MKKLFRNSFKEVLQQEALSEEVAETILEPNVVNHSQEVSQVVPPAKISETTIEEATKLFDR